MIVKKYNFIYYSGIIHDKGYCVRMSPSLKQIKMYLKVEKKLTKVKSDAITEANVVEQFALYSSVSKKEVIKPLKVKLPWGLINLIASKISPSAPLQRGVRLVRVKINMKFNVASEQKINKIIVFYT